MSSKNKEINKEMHVNQIIEDELAAPKSATKGETVESTDDGMDAGMDTISKCDENPINKYCYRHNYIADFYRQKLVGNKLCDDCSGPNYMIEVPIPIDYETEDDAIHCAVSLRFEEENGHVVLRIYERGESGTDSNGHWLEHVSGNVIETVHWEDIYKYRHASKSRLPAKEMPIWADTNIDYIPDATPWDVIFEETFKLPGFRCTLECLAYRIELVERTEQ